MVFGVYGRCCLERFGGVGGVLCGIGGVWVCWGHFWV